MTNASFRFRLERVRALRERHEELAKEQLARAIQLSQRSREHLRGLEDDLEHARCVQRDALGQADAVGGDALMAHQAFLERIECERSAGEGELARTEADVAMRGVQLGQASRDRQSLERLKDRKRTEHEREQLRREGLVLDDIAIERFRRSAA